MKRAMKRCIALAAVFGMVGAIAGYVALSATPAAATTSTNVGVGAVDMAPVHNTTSQQEWAFEDTDTQSGTLGFVSGPATPPLGTGSLAMSMADPPGQHEWIVNYSYGPCADGWSPCNTTPVNLSAFTALSYETYRTSGGQMPTLNIEVSPPGTGSGYTTFVYVPDPSQYADNQWQPWDAFNDATPHWYSTHNVTNPSAGVFNCTPQTAGCYATWAQIVASYPSAFVLGGIGPNIGTGGNFVGNVDALTIGVSSANIVYDFEPPCSTDCYVATTGRDSATGQADDPYKTINEGLSAVNAGGTVHVAAGTYDEQVTVTKAVTFDGAQAGVDARTGRITPANESIVDNANGAFVVASNAVTIDGFTVSGATNGNSNTGGAGILTQTGASGFHIQNNIVTNNIIGYYAISNGASANTVTHNRFVANTQSGPASGTGVYGDQGLQNTSIQSNLFSGNPNDAVVITQFTGTNTGITIDSNAADNGIVLEDASSSSITNNTLTGTGGSAIYLDGDNGITVTGNTVSASPRGLRLGSSDFGADSNIAANHNLFNSNTRGVLVDAGAIGANVHVNDNDLSSDSTSGVENDDTTVLDGTCNWWGSGNGPSGSGSGSGSAVSTNVTFVEWLGSSNLNGTCGRTVSIGADQTFPEGSSGQHTDFVPVTLSSPQATNVTVHYATAVGTARSNSDYLNATGTLTIPAGQTSGLIALTIIGDTTPEPNQSFTVNLANPSAGVTVGRATTTITLLNDDIKATMASAATTEGNVMAFTFKLKFPMAHAVTVHFCTNANGLASPSQTPTPDYTFTACPGSANVTINPGNLTATVFLQTYRDGITEPAETFQMQASVASPDTVNLTATGTIRANRT